MEKAKALYGIVRAVRSGFHLLKSVGDALHEDVGVTSAMRAVMESVADHGPQTVPAIARSKHVSRQHIQTLADQLVGDGLATFAANPAHKKSNLLDFTPKGERTFRAMRTREADVLSELAKHISQQDLMTTLKTLTCLNGLLEDQLRKGDNDI